jgi:hypothetical protein
VWQVETSPGIWENCRSREEAELVARAIILQAENNPNQQEVREVLAGLRQHGYHEGNLLYRKLKAKLKEES